MASQETWYATLLEVKRQALLHLQPSEGSDTPTGEWVKVEPPQPRDADWSELWPQQQWQVAFEILFCQVPSSAKGLQSHQDDLLFFVCANPAAQPGNPRGFGSTSGSPLFVRRRAQQLPAELQWGGARSGDVDWRGSVLLNLVLQTGYWLSVATCRYADLPELVSREGPALPASTGGGSSTASSSSFPSAGGSSGSLPAASGPVNATSLSSGGSGGPESSAAAGSRGSIQEVCKVVYASPTKVHLSLDSSRGPSQNPALCYPDIAFAVEDFDHAFSSVVLTEPEDCYSVLLYSDARGSWCPAEPTLAGDAASAAAEVPARGAGATATLESEQGTGEASLARRLADLSLQPGSKGQASIEKPPDGSDTSRSQPGSSAAASGAAAAPPAGPAAAPTADTAGPARAPAAQPPGPVGGPFPGGNSPAEAGKGAMPLVFSGFVSHQLLADAMAPKLKGSALLGGGWAHKTSRVVMRGPGGLGSADVAVTSLPGPAGQQGEDGGKKGGPLLGRLARGVVEAARQAAGAAGVSGGSPVPPLRLKCALMTLLVPVDMLAVSILEALCETSR
ncbi:hypothetical protein N2152v2_007192 [Parachlorella kessleri]